MKSVSAFLVSVNARMSSRTLYGRTPLGANQQIVPKHHRCVCGHDMFEEYRAVKTKGKTATFATVFKCAKCKRETSGG